MGRVNEHMIRHKGKGAGPNAAHHALVREVNKPKRRRRAQQWFDSVADLMKGRR